MALEDGRLRALCPGRCLCSAMKKQCGGQKSNLRIHIVRSLQTQPLQTRIQLSFKTWMQEEQSSKAYLCCCLCADWFAREAAADTCGIMKIKHWVRIWRTLSKTHWIWWILQCRCPPRCQAPQAKLLVSILQIITGDMFKYGEIFNWSHSVSRYHQARTLLNPAKLQMLTSSMHESACHNWLPLCKDAAADTCGLMKIKDWVQIWITLQILH